MKERKFFRIAGLFMILAAFWVDGMLFLRVQGNSPVSVVTVGDVSAMLMEAGEAGAEDEEGWQLVVEDARPGQAISCNPVVCMSDDSKQAYIRAKVSVEGLSKKKGREILEHLEQMPSWNYNPQDGYYYFKDPVSAGQQIPVFECVHIPEQWKGADKFQVDIMVEVVQTSRLIPKIDAECRMLEWIPAGRAKLD